MFQFKPKWLLTEKRLKNALITEPIELETDGSLFKAPVTSILKIENHPNADRLEIAYIFGFQVIIQKGKYSIGQQILYVPIDSILPEWLETKLFPVGSQITLNNSRIRQIRIRKIASQGIIIDLEDIKEKVNIDYLTPEQDLSKILGIEKYEPPKRKDTSTKPATPRNKKLENPRFHQYGGIDNIKWYPTLFEGKEVIIQEKLHGCVQASTKIRMANGSIRTIKEIVNNNIQEDVLGTDKNGNLVNSKILNRFNNGNQAKWLKILTTRVKAGRGKHVNKITCTTNHKFFMVENKQYKQASDLQIGDKVYLLRDDYTLTFLQKEVLKGKMLGDGHLSTANHVSFGHKKGHESYIDYTLKILGNIAGNKQKDIVSGYGTLIARAKTISRDDISELFSNWKINEVKQVPNDIQLSPISLAFWYMDDGSLAHHEDQNDRAQFATCAFSEESIDNLLNALNKLGINGVKRITDEKYWRIYLNCDNADKLFVMIAPYVPQCMQYKLPEIYRQGDNIFKPHRIQYKPDLTVQEITSIENDHHDYDRYDIETETHNYFANDLLVHNSNCRASFAKSIPNTLWKKVLNFFGKLPTYEYCYGRNRVQLQQKRNKTGYYGTDVYGDVIKKLDIFSKLKQGETVYGELIGPGIQKGYDYGHKEHHFVLFDVKVEQPDCSQEYLDPEKAEEYAKERGFDFVPTLYKGIFNAEMAKQLVTGNSVYCPQEKVKEGIVVKIRTGYSVNGSKQALKMINEAYLDDMSNTDNH